MAITIRLKSIVHSHSMTAIASSALRDTQSCLPWIRTELYDFWMDGDIHIRGICDPHLI